MTDKVQKIRKEVQRLQNELIQEKEKGFGSDTDDACILELQNVLTYIDSLQEEPVSEEFKQEYEKYITNHKGEWIREDYEAFAQHFANWQKQQMMAKAVNGEVTYGKSLAIPSLGLVLDKEGLDYGDKVKLVIIKEE